jgi:hypothetical protein
MIKIKLLIFTFALLGIEFSNGFPIIYRSSDIIDGIGIDNNIKGIDENNNMPCNTVKNYYAQSHIIEHHINYRMLNDDNNVSFYGIVTLEYKTLPYCKYTCNMQVINNMSKHIFVSKYFIRYFQIGSILHLMCNSKLCTWGNINCYVNTDRKALFYEL